jgi:YHS domain-containing protein
MKILLSIWLAVGLAFTLTARAEDHSLQNLGDNHLAIQGYDPVAYFTDHKPVKGKPEISARADGALYFFATKEHRDMFKKEPAKYEPQFGGYCAYGVAHNKLVKIDPAAFQIVDDKLLLQYSKSIVSDFNEDKDANLAKANENWPGLVTKHK